MTTKTNTQQLKKQSDFPLAAYWVFFTAHLKKNATLSHRTDIFHKTKVFVKLHFEQVRGEANMQSRVSIIKANSSLLLSSLSSYLISALDGLHEIDYFSNPFRLPSDSLQNSSTIRGRYPTYSSLHNFQQSREHVDCVCQKLQFKSF